mmetsp:Transcript_14950/g.31932  ORF Transcript_14950/g.31932 Transcript_14950/m.31932 type:complete len:91 (-) Transcript_14950:422-694(-)
MDIVDKYNMHTQYESPASKIKSKVDEVRELQKDLLRVQQVLKGTQTENDKLKSDLRNIIESNKKLRDEVESIKTEELKLNPKSLQDYGVA